ncbi:hypothetical protein CVT26_015519 [Gymnopilus dilepis]|uniref:Uncharacterized protein n=1 Tax=Gymnopilus dilepis TaxID=231916 RepID=A0A409YD20_9AGAR|nr:hypothetical protein CVT26_015519 [Gymnopilus dilepis]
MAGGRVDMLNREGRQLVKRFLSFARAKLLYSRITLTRFTTLYFFFALTSCIVLSILQGITFADNSAGVAILSPFINISTDPIILLDNKGLRTCTSVPNQPGTSCVLRQSFFIDFNQSSDSSRQQSSGQGAYGVEPDEDDDKNNLRLLNKELDVLQSSLAKNCIISLGWVGEAIEDAKREDVVTMLFQIWLLSLALVAILNESIPHLGAAFLGHVLNTAWAGYRIRSTLSLTNLYRSKIVAGACQDVDVMGHWWDVKLQHSIPFLIVNLIILLAFAYLSCKLYKVYANQSFSRVGASQSVLRIYKLVLIFSVCLQLSGFFSVAAAGMWLNKVCYGFLMKLAQDANVYMAAFIVILVGWVCVRRECGIRFGIFCAISCLLLAISSALFSSPVYRYIFTTWPFFATVTITAYVLLMATSILGVVCRLNFGKGLAHYLRVTDALEDADFTPVSFSRRAEIDVEKVDFNSFKPAKSESLSEPVTAPISIQLPVSSFKPVQRQSVKDRFSALFRGSMNSTDTIKLSSSPPLISELGPRPIVSRSRLSVASSFAGRQRSENVLKLTRQKDERIDPSVIPPVLPSKPSRSPQDLPRILTDPPSRTSSRAGSPIQQGTGLPANPRGQKAKKGATEQKVSAGTDFGQQ